MLYYFCTFDLLIKLKFTIMKTLTTTTKVQSLINSMKHEPSNYQVDVFNAVDDTNKNIVVNAVAGSGKTTTLMNILSLINDKKVLVVAFSKEIQKELTAKVTNLGLNAKVQTAHAFGFTQLMRNGIKVENNGIKSNKYKQLYKYAIKFNKGENKLLEVFPNLNTQQINVLRTIEIPNYINDDNYKQYTNNINKLVDFIRLFDVENNTQAISEICYKYNLTLLGNEIDIATRLINVGKSYTKIIDYTDMIFLPISLKLRIDSFDFVLIDECQDINNSARKLLLSARKYNEGRFIAVGDENQAIFGFAGANSESFNELKKQFNTITLPLSTCYRCGSNIIELAQPIVPQITAHKSTGEGLVNNDAKLKDIKANDMVLCRNTAPLVALCLQYIKNGIVAMIKGNDIKNGIINLINDTNKTLPSDIINQLYIDLEKYAEIIAKAKHIDICEVRDEQEYKLQQDKVNVVELLAENCNNAQDIITKLNAMFSDDNVKNAIQLCTIHKSKGLEADNVFIIERALMPSKFAKQEWEKQQEQNLIYVAYTRAKKVLGFITDWSYNSDNAETLKNKANIIVPEFVGTIGSKVSSTFTISDIQQVIGFDGQPTNVYTLTDNNGNIWIKWNTIDIKHIVSENKVLEIGTKVKCQVLIKSHTAFKGNKVNNIKTISTYNPKTEIAL